MVSHHIDSEFLFFDKMLLPKIEKLDLDDDDFDNIPLEFLTVETSKFLPLNDNVIDCETPNELGNDLHDLEFLCLIGNSKVVDMSQQLDDNDRGKGYGITGPLLSCSNSSNLR